MVGSKTSAPINDRVQDQPIDHISAPVCEFGEGLYGRSNATLDVWNARAREADGHIALGKDPAGVGWQEKWRSIPKFMCSQNFAAISKNSCPSSANTVEHPLT
ncbi:hypothetical protein [Bradyrhizobium sp. AZCC 2262]|uniref:hypothetical protein n=1 Tax=Bradyrhizobium sp. AZCC 2262 TaxID=3117022 RepID=UPI002FF0AC1C